MPKKILVIAPLLFLFITSTTGQNLEDYIALAKNSVNQSERFIFLDSVISKSHRTHPDNFLKYSLIYIALAKELDSIEGAAKKAINST